jgi:hypothetical protein
MTVGELREYLKPLTDECEVLVFAADKLIGSSGVMKTTIEFADGEGYFVLHAFPLPERYKGKL